MKTKLIYALLGAALLPFYGCEKGEKALISDDKVELYLLESFSTIGTSRQIDESAVLLKQQPLIVYADFLYYDTSDFSFGLSDKAVNAINNIQHSTFGVPFAITVNDTLIYTAYFWPSYSSGGCNWAVVDPIMTRSGEMQVRLGYPGQFPGQTIPDRRNDRRIVNVFKNDNKIK